MPEELKVTKIEHGTVIDHIRPGLAPQVLNILGIDRDFPSTVIVAMNVQSLRHQSKDIVKVENQILDKQEMNKIAIISPNATINIIQGFEVIEKRKVTLPHELIGIAKCPNRNCITNHEAIESFFIVECEAPLELRCHYCEDLFGEDRVEIYR
ncbi:MAG: aspartate carbamoyltransferase regulatory subunit [Candidatus Bipolaricaulia bacterium]